MSIVFTLASKIPMTHSNWQNCVNTIPAATFYRK